MATGIWALEWLNHNAQRNYPLADSASTKDQTGTFQLPDDFLVELDLPVHAGMNVDPARFFVKHVGAFPSGYSLVFGYQPDSGDPVDVAVVSIERTTHTKNRCYAVSGVEDFDDTTGKVVIGSLDNIDKQPPGWWTFDLNGSRIDPDCIRPLLRGVSAIICENGTDRSVPLYGDIVLSAGTNCQLVPVISGTDDPIVRISFIEGEGTVEECVCVGGTTDAPPIRMINGVRPTPSGQFYLVGSDCVRLDPIPNGLKIVNTCASPCCGPEELERITQDLRHLSREQVELDRFLQRLQWSVETMSLIVLGSRLKDQGCAQTL